MKEQHRGGGEEREEGNHNRERGGRDRMLQVANCQREFVATVSRNAKALHECCVSWPAAITKTTTTTTATTS